MLCQEKTDGAVRRLQEELFEAKIGLNWFWRIETSNLGVQSVREFHWAVRHCLEVEYAETF